MRDVVVIGAGPAGCLAALLLARRQVPVLLIEQHRFPRDKVCGECLSALALDVLARAELLCGIDRLGAMALKRVALHSHNGKSATLDLPRPMRGISRAVFDNHLLDAARAAGAMVRQPARCESIQGGPSPCVRLRDLMSNRIEMLHPEHVIVADGKGSLIASRSRCPSDLGIKAHFEDVNADRDTIELFGCRGLYGGLAPIEGRWNAAFSVPAERVRRARGNIERVFSTIIWENPTLRRKMAGARRIGDWLAAPLWRFPLCVDSVDRIVRIGNAASAIEPIGGEGIGLALRSAELAVDALTQGGGYLNGQLRSEMSRLWRVRGPTCRGAALLVSRPPFAGSLVRLAARLPSAARWSMQLLGK